MFEKLFGTGNICNIGYCISFLYALCYLYLVGAVPIECSINSHINEETAIVQLQHAPQHYLQVLETQKNQRKLVDKKG